MNDLLIDPWDVDETKYGEFYVPDYITQLGEQVLHHYNFTVESMELVTTKSDKGGAIWKLETSEGPKSFKLLHRRPARSLFSLGAQQYLVDVQKAKVPPIVQTKYGQNYVEAGGKLWFVAEWIEPLFPVTKDLAGAKQLCYALGEFHRLSKGYIPPKQAEMASRLNKWPKTYEKMLVKMDWFRNIAKAYSDLPASPLLLSVVNQFEEQAKRSLERLMQSSYFELAKREMNTGVWFTKIMAGQTGKWARMACGLLIWMVLPSTFLFGI